MFDTVSFKNWLIQHGYAGRVASDIPSRAKRADTILEWDNTETYLFYLEQQDAFKALSVSVRSQLRKSIKLYQEFSKSE